MDPFQRGPPSSLPPPASPLPALCPGFQGLRPPPASSQAALALMGPHAVRSPASRRARAGRGEGAQPRGAWLRQRESHSRPLREGKLRFQLYLPESGFQPEEAFMAFEAKHPRYKQFSTRVLHICLYNNLCVTAFMQMTLKWHLFF